MLLTGAVDKEVLKSKTFKVDFADVEHIEDVFEKRFSAGKSTWYRCQSTSLQTVMSLYTYC